MFYIDVSTAVSGPCAGTRDRVLKVVEELRRYSKAGKYDRNKESLRSAEKILGSGKSTAKTKKTV